VVLQSRRIRLIVSPCAGARAFVFEDLANSENLFTTIGGLRDAWQQQLPPSGRDYIAKYTHPIATGTFNRCYAITLDPAHARAAFTYTAPDAPPHGASFRKTIALDRAGSGFTVHLAASFPRSTTQRAQQLTSIAVDRDTRIEQRPSGVVFFEPSKHRTLLISWNRKAVEKATVERHPADALLTLTLARGADPNVHFAMSRT
jgi:hypothetical protein